MTPAEILRAARAKIAEPEHWTKGEYVLFNEADEPDRWCAVGSIYAVDPEVGNDPEHPSLRALVVALRGVYEGLASEPSETSVLNFNDSANTSHEDVLAAFDRAIELAGAA